MPASRVVLADGFWTPRRDRLLDVTLPGQWERLEADGHVRNLRISARAASGVVEGLPFFDSDVWKWTEAAALMLDEDAGDDGLAGRVAEVVSLAAAAQEPDGYLNTYHQAFAADLRWRSLLLNHELYCAGHLVEAACAHHEVTGDAALLDVARGVADDVVARFRDGDEVPGHEEMELALARLAAVTGDRSYLEMASRFVERRGRAHRYRRALLASLATTVRVGLRASRARRAAGVRRRDEDSGFSAREGPVAWGRLLAQLWSGVYFQDAVPVRDLDAAEGHAVRALYLLAGAADVAAATGDAALLAAVEGIWRRTVARRTYVTGGAGSLPLVEGFGRDWELPNRSYAETCSAVASARLSWRILTGRSRSDDTAAADWMERALYNGVLSGISLSGDRYFYRNPLQSHGEHERLPWFQVACCPPNVARTLAALPSTVWTTDAGGMQLHLLVGNTATFDTGDGPVAVSVTTGLPWTGDVRIAVSVAAGSARFRLAVRVPAWAGAASARLGAEPVPGASPGRYLVLSRRWNDADTVELELGLAPRWVPAPAQVRENRGRVALLRGPLVYCAEGVDNPGADVHTTPVAVGAAPVERWCPDLLGGVVTVAVPARDGSQLRLVPYYTWANRGPTDMAVWFRAGS